MKRILVMAMGLVLLFTVTASAKKRNLKLFVPGTVNGAQLNPGDYELEVKDNEAVFFKRGKEVARTAVRIEPAPKKNDRDSILYDSETITEIRLAGSSDKLLLSPGSMASKPGKSDAKTNN